MFDNLSQRLQTTLKRLRGEGRLSEQNMAATLRDVRVALLEADVALTVVKAFLEEVRAKAVGQEVLASLSPGQALLKIVYDELVRLMGETNARLNLAAPPPAVILLAGLQGSGKTTTAAKLARFVRERENKSVMLVSCDIYRPAALEQLQKLAIQVDAVFFTGYPDETPVAIARRAVEEARRKLLQVVIVDSAGRLHVDKSMMQEIKALHAVLDPVETLFVADSMTGQDAVNSAKAFNEALPLTGVILTKADGDARGGAALSIRYVTGRPIKFLGVGEASAALETFFPERVASRILGMGDMLTLVEEAVRASDQQSNQVMARKLFRGKGLDLDDFRAQLLQMEKIGGVAALMQRLPGMAQIPEGVKAQVDDRQLQRLVAIINAMTLAERHNPDIIRGSRRRRIAAGSGTSVQEVNRLLKQFNEMQKVIQQFGKRDWQHLWRDMKNSL